MPPPEDPNDITAAPGAVEQEPPEQGELLDIPANEPKKGKRQKTLPGMENKHLEDIEEAAITYAGIRDRRMELTRQETDARDLLMQVMKRHSKTEYRVEEMEIRIVPVDEKIKVRILGEKEE
jgi:hypothetical protein